MSSFPHQRPYRRRSHHQFRTELSGLERPRQWLGVFVAAITTLLAIFLLSLLLV